MKSAPSFRSFLCAGIAALVLAATMQTVCIAQGSVKAADYWPFKTGNTWTLVTKVADKSISQVVTVTKVTTASGKTTATLDYKVDDKSVQVEVYQVDSKSMSRLASGAGASNKLNPAFPIIQAPLTSGKKWSWKGTVLVNGQTVNGDAVFLVSGPETIKTEAGNFQAMKVHVDLTMSGQGQNLKLANDYWFAPNVGLVKQKVQIGTSVIEGILTRYKLQK